MGTFSIWHWIIVLVIVVLVFGTKKLRNLGGDLGNAIKGFKDGMKESEPENTTPPPHVNDQIIDVQARKETSASAFKESNAPQPSHVNNPIAEPDTKEKNHTKT